MGERIDFKPGNMLNPTPVVMVSCQRPGEKPNIITIAWTGTICSDPPMLSISVRPERHSYGIIKDTGEFAVNLVNESLTYAADYCGVKSGKTVDKYKEMGLKPVELSHIGCPGIEGSPAILECKVKERIPLGTHDLFIADIVGVNIDGEYMDENNVFHINESGLVVYSHGEYYRIGEKLGKFGYSVQKNK